MRGLDGPAGGAMLAKNDIKVGLDIGSSQIHVIVSERDDDYNLHLIDRKSVV